MRGVETATSYLQRFARIASEKGREQAIREMLRDGLSFKGIGAALGIHKGTARAFAIRAGIIGANRQTHRSNLAKERMSASARKAWEARRS